MNGEKVAGQIPPLVCIEYLGAYREEGAETKTERDSVLAVLVAARAEAVHALQFSKAAIASELQCYGPRGVLEPIYKIVVACNGCWSQRASWTM